jgi:hypothetical protein
MKLISHRGNLVGPEPSKENTITFIQDAIDQGYDVEIDVRLIDGLYLGHDQPDYRVDLAWLLERKDRLWVHTKNFAAMDFLIDHGLQVFYHQLEKHTVIGNTRVIWSHDISEASEKSIIPLISLEDIEEHQCLNMKFYGVCSDYIKGFKS